MGYAVIKGERKKGYGTEAVQALLVWGLSQKGITADCFEDNIASINILTKIGMEEINRKNGLLFFRSK